MNPHNTAEACCLAQAWNPPLGRTHMWGYNATKTVRIVTNVGTDSGGNDWLRSTVTKE